MAKKANKKKTANYLKNKWVLLGVGLFLALGVVFGYQMFAAGKPTVKINSVSPSKNSATVKYTISGCNKTKCSKAVFNFSDSRTGLGEKSITIKNPSNGKGSVPKGGLKRKWPYAVRIRIYDKNGNQTTYAAWVSFKTN